MGRVEFHFREGTLEQAQPLGVDFYISAPTLGGKIINPINSALLTVKWNSVLYSIPTFLLNTDVSLKGRYRVNRITNLAAATVMSLVASVSLALTPVAAESSTPLLGEHQVANRCYQTGKIKVHAKPEQVWAVLTDYTQQTKVFKRLRKCQVIADKGTTKVLYHEVHPTGQPATFEYKLEMKETQPNRSLEWRRISGDFKELEGFWKLEPADGGRNTLVTYGSYVNGGFFIPQALIKRQFRIDTPLILSSLKDRVEGVPQIASNHREASQP